MKAPVVALVGAPNVGKSTLFNRLTHTRDALVAKIKHLTRDRNYRTVSWEDRAVTLIDTGGISEEKNPLAASVEVQVNLALVEANLILFMVDGKKGLTAQDEILAKKLRSLNKPIILVINKMDSREEMVSDFLGLGFSFFTISAEHNLGIVALQNALLKQLPVVPFQEKASPLRLILLGKPNVGKSTLINYLLGENRVITSDIAGTTRDALEIAFVHQGINYCLIDTAGLRKQRKIIATEEQLAALKVNQALARSDIVFLLIDAKVGITDQDLNLVGAVWKQGKIILLAVNKADCLNKEQRKTIAQIIDRRLAFASVPCYWISAHTGEGIKGMLKGANQLYRRAHQPFKTNQLNRILDRALFQHHPPLVYGHPIKIRYMHFGHYDPLTFILHGSKLKHLPDSYLRYLERCFRKAFSLEGIPLRLVFEEKTR